MGFRPRGKFYCRHGPCPWGGGTLSAVEPRHGRAALGPVSALSSDALGLLWEWLRGGDGLSVDLVLIWLLMSANVISVSMRYQWLNSCPLMPTRISSG
jgi:hypothetical protein